MNNKFKKIFEPTNFIILVFFAPIVWMMLGKFYQLLWATLFPCVDKYCDAGIAPFFFTTFTAVAMICYVLVKASE